LNEAEMTSLSSRVRRLRLYFGDQPSDLLSGSQTVGAALVSEQGELRVAGGHS